MFCKIVSLLLIVLSAISTIKSDEFNDYENTLLNNEDTRFDIIINENNNNNQHDKCISHNTENEAIEERGMFMKEAQTSFIPYCRHENLPNTDRDLKFDPLLSELKKRNRRMADVINALHFESMHTLTPEQIRSSQANIMKRYMDTTVNPCNDFYAYACGNWAKYNSIPSDKISYDTFEILRESLDKALKDLLADEKDERKKIKRNKRTHDKRLRRHEKNAEMKAKNLFHSCMNYEQIEKRNVEPLMELLESLGGWPLLDKNWDEKNFDWLELVANLRRFNNDILIMQYVGADIHNSNLNVIQFDQATLALPSRDYFLKPINEKYLNSYRNFITQTINLLGVELYEAKDRADEIIEFETNLAKIMSAQEDRTNISELYHNITLSELQKEIPGIDWIRYLTIVQERVVDANEVVIMFAKHYMQELVKLIDNSEPANVANYLLWRFVRHRINNLDDRFLEVKQKFYQECFGREKSPERWKQCISQVNSNMGMAVGALFVRKYFDENSKLDTLTMVRELQMSFKEIINNTDWIDEVTKATTIKKLENMSLKVGFPDYIISRHKLDEKYSALHIHPDKYFENTLNVLKYLNKEEQKKVGQTVNKTIWQTYPALVNAFYSRSKNQIMFPAGILQPPFYHRHFPKSINYGGIGVVIGHECTHGFDDKGRLFDKDGNLNKVWSDYSIKQFREKAKCLIQQFNKYTLTEIGESIDGETTQGENIADGGGLNQAYRAYTRWLNNQKDPKVLENEVFPELNLTSKQLFFLNFGQVWCGEIREEANKNKMKTAVHSPGRFRVIGALSNFDEFSKEFNCPIGSVMNPQNKCKVW